MAKQRQSAVPAAVVHLAAPHWQAKSRATLRALLQASSQVMRRALSQAKTADPPSPGLRRAGWRPPLLGLQAQAKLLVTAASWRPALLERQD
jgi:hypothetical protein